MRAELATQVYTAQTHVELQLDISECRCACHAIFAIVLALQYKVVHFLRFSNHHLEEVQLGCVCPQDVQQPGVGVERQGRLRDSLVYVAEAQVQLCVDGVLQHHTFCSHALSECSSTDLRGKADMLARISTIPAVSRQPAGLSFTSDPIPLSTSTFTNWLSLQETEPFSYMGASVQPERCIGQQQQP